MKKIMILLIVTAVSLGASAQRHFAGHSSYRRSHVVVSVGGPAYYSPFYYGYYDPFFYPYYPRYYPGETRLEVRIDDIRNDYRDKLWSARHDKSLSRSKRKVVIHQLKHDRDKAINEAKTKYYQSR